MNKEDVLDKYYSYLDENELYSVESKELYLKFLLSLNDSLYDAYVLLMELYYKSEDIGKGYGIIKLGYNKLMKNEFNNVFPKELDYYEVRNRDIYRLIYNYADSLWLKEDTKGAMSLFKKLIDICPSDNLGVRYAICGILEGYESSYQIWNEQNQNIEIWFKEKMKKHISTKGYEYMRIYLEDK